MIEVSAINPETTQSLADSSSAIEQQLVSSKQQQIATDFQSDFVDKWTPRTVCAPDETIELCSNFVAPETPTAPGQPTPPAVISRQPIEPGTSTISIDGSAQQGAPPGTAAAADEERRGAGAAGAVPLGPNGAPTGAPPGTTAPPDRRSARHDAPPADDGAARDAAPPGTTAPPTTAP